MTTARWDGYAPVMRFIRRPLQRKLSQLLGAEVTFERLDVSLVGGSVDAQGLVVAGSAPGAPPLLTVRRLRAAISVSKALGKEIVVKSLTLERPELNLTGPAPRAAPTGLPSPVAEGEDADDPDTTAAAAWRLEAQKVLVVDGAVHLRATTAAGPYDVSANGVLADLSAAGAGMDFTCIVESLQRNNPDVDLGEVRLTGRADGVRDLSQWPKARVVARLDVGKLLKADVSLPSVRPVEAVARVTGELDLAVLASLLPAVVPALVPAGSVQVDARVGYDATRGVRIHELNLRGVEIALAPRTAGTV